MRVVLASRFVREAPTIVSAWGGGASLLTPDDLASPGWIHRPGDSRRSRAVIDGERVPYRDIVGLWPITLTVTPFELPQIVERDRPYIAAEMSAFLREVIVGLTGRVVNQRQGPWMAAWSPERWRWEAWSLGLRVVADDQPVTGSRELVTVVGGEIVGPAVLGEMASRLARAHGLDLLTLLFDDGRVAGASTRPPLADPAVVHAIGRFLGGAS